jgi:hypothetical protein
LGLKTKLKYAYGQFNPVALVSETQVMLFLTENYNFIFHTNVTGRNYVDGKAAGAEGFILLRTLSSPAWPTSISPEKLFLQEDHTQTQTYFYMDGPPPLLQPHTPSHSAHRNARGGTYVINFASDKHSTLINRSKGKERGIKTVGSNRKASSAVILQLLPEASPLQFVK